MNQQTPHASARLGRVVAVVVAALLGGAVTFLAPAPAHAAPVALDGLFKLTPGSQTGTAAPKGTYFRMLQPNGTTYLTNLDSRAADKTYTVLNPGTDGGLRTGTFQAQPSPAFDGSGNALSGKITAPESFFGVKFGTATNPVDPQTGSATTAPKIYANGSVLTGDLRALAASWNAQHFNQGAPKPNGTLPGHSQAVSGTYNAGSKAFHITWRSLIVGGPFNNFTGEWHFVGTFVPNLVIGDATFPAGTIGKSYSAKLTATGGKGSYAWSVASGALPTGLKLSAQGAISGTPTAPGTFNFTAQVADGDVPKNITTKAFSITVPPIAIVDVAVPGGLVGKAYVRTTFKATSGKGTLTWTVASGALPAGIVLSKQGVLSGTPTAAGTSNATIRVADAAVPSNAATKAISITIAPITINDIAVPGGLVGKAYVRTTFKATGGKGSLVWSVASGTLPAGLTLSAQGALSGTPTAAGTSNVTIQVADSAVPKNIATKAISITIAPVTIATSTLPNGTFNKYYSAKFTANGGKGSLVWTLTAGTLPTGVKLATSGALSGTPKETGSFPITVQVADASVPKNIVTKNFTLVIG